jgi:hypothetical protein
MNRSVSIAAAIAAAAWGTARAADDPRPADGRDPFEVSVKLNRAAPVYAVGDGLSLTIQSNRDATVRIWLVDSAGKLSPIAPSAADDSPPRLLPGRPLRVPAKGEIKLTSVPGRYELRVTAVRRWAETRSLFETADARLPGESFRQQRSVTFVVEDPENEPAHPRRVAHRASGSHP